MFTHVPTSLYSILYLSQVARSNAHFAVQLQRLWEKILTSLAPGYSSSYAHRGKTLCLSYMCPPVCRSIKHAGSSACSRGSQSTPTDMTGWAVGFDSFVLRQMINLLEKTGIKTRKLFGEISGFLFDWR